MYILGLLHLARTSSHASTWAVSANVEHASGKCMMPGVPFHAVSIIVYVRLVMILTVSIALQVQNNSNCF